MLEEAHKDLSIALGQLEAHLGPGPFAVAEELTLADCALAPLMFFVDRFANALFPGYSRAEWARLAACTAHIPSHPAAASVLELIESSVKPLGRAS